MNKADWDNLWHEVRRELLINTNPVAYPNADPWDSTATIKAVDRVVGNIMNQVRQYTLKLEDEIHRSHHD